MPDEITGKLNEKICGCVSVEEAIDAAMAEVKKDINGDGCVLSSLVTAILHVNILANAQAHHAIDEGTEKPEALALMQSVIGVCNDMARRISNEQDDLLAACIHLANTGQSCSVADGKELVRMKEEKERQEAATVPANHSGVDTVQ